MAHPRRLVHLDPDPQYRHLVRLAVDGRDDLTVVADRGCLDEGPALVAAAGADAVLVEPLVAGRLAVDELAALRRATEGPVVLLTALPGDVVGGGGRGPAPVTGAVAPLAPLGHLDKAVRPTRLGGELRALLDVLSVVHGAVAEASTDLAPDLISPRRAREFVTDTLERWHCRDATAIIDLLVSELVANAVLHAGTPAQLSVQLLPDRMRVTVTDGDPAQPKRRTPDPRVSSGRGIALVEQLALAWGIERSPGGKRVWFETPRPDGPDTHRPACDDAPGTRPAGPDASTRSAPVVPR